MNKFIKVLLALMLVVVSLLTTACGGNSDKPELPDVEESTPATEETIADVVTVTESVIYDAADVKVTVIGLSEGLLGTKLDLLIENNSEKNIVVSSELISVNGFMMPYGSLYCEVASGKKANDFINLISTELEHAKIDELSVIEFRLEIQDRETWDTIAKSDMITVQTSVVDYTQVVDDTGLVTVYENDDYKIVCKGLLEDEVWEGSLAFYIENNTDRTVSVYAENVSINDYMNDVTFWCDLKPNTKIIDGLKILELEAPGITSIQDIKNIELNFRIIDFETWDELLVTDKIVLTFE